MLSAELLKAQIYEFLLSAGIEVEKKRYGQFYAPGNDDLLLFDITNEYPETAADFTENRGRAVITGPVGGAVSDLGAIAQWPLTIACFAIESPDAGYLAEHILRKLRGWSRRHFPSLNGQCLHSLYSFRLSGAVRLEENSMFFSVVQFTATVQFGGTMAPLR